MMMSSVAFRSYCQDNISNGIGIRGGSRIAAASKMECFVIIVNGWKPLTIITKRSILDVAGVLDPPLSIFLLQYFFLWRDRTSISNPPQYYFLCLVFGLSFWYNYLFLYNFLLIHSDASIGSTRTLAFRRKISRSENFCKLSTKTSMLESFFNTFRSSEQLFCREPVRTCFCKKEFNSTRYLMNFPKY